MLVTCYHNHNKMYVNRTHSLDIDYKMVTKTSKDFHCRYILISISHITKWEYFLSNFAKNGSKTNEIRNSKHQYFTINPIGRNFNSFFVLFSVRIIYCCRSISIEFEHCMYFILMKVCESFYNSIDQSGQMK